jgi:hypothetical protein
MLSVMPEACQQFFNFFTRYYFRTRLRQPDGSYEKDARFGRRDGLPMSPASSFFGDTALQAVEFGERRSELSLL